jgi:predicted Rossmann fold nucleotide-binding protein DprA/Smf involved in DNA uptake
MPHHVTMIEPTSPDFPTALLDGALVASSHCIWAIGNLDILKTRMVGFFCSTKCPGSVIVHIYDPARTLRDAGISVISGFHAPMERECLDLLLRGTQPVVICPARNIERMRLPTAWRTPIVEGHLLILSPFSAPHRRPTTDLAEQRNLFVSALATTLVIAHARRGSKIDQLSAKIVASGKQVYTLDLPENTGLMDQGVTGYAVPDLVDCILGQPVRIES